MASKARLCALAILVVLLATFSHIGAPLAIDRYPAGSPYEEVTVLKADQRKPPPGQLRARFMGVSTILLDNDRTQILVDGFFTRPTAWQMLSRPVSPDSVLIDGELKKLHLKKLVAVLTAHSHVDHAFDAPLVAAKTNAELVGSRSIAEIALGHGIETTTIIHGGEELSYDGFRVTTYCTPHSPGGPAKGDVQRVLDQPAWALSYKEGPNFSYLVEHQGLRILIHPSANYAEGLYKGLKADVVFLGVARLGRLGAKDFAERYWEEVVVATKPSLVIPVHWDNFTHPLSAGLQPMKWPLDNTKTGLARLVKLARKTQTPMALMPLGDPIVLPPKSEWMLDGSPRPPIPKPRPGCS